MTIENRSRPMTRFAIVRTLLSMFIGNGIEAGTLDWELPSTAVADRVSITRRIGPDRKETWARPAAPDGS
jgi:hypothetical protein